MGEEEQSEKEKKLSWKVEYISESLKDYKERIKFEEKKERDKKVPYPPIEDEGQGDGRRDTMRSDKPHLIKVREDKIKRENGTEGNIKIGYIQKLHNTSKVPCSGLRSWKKIILGKQRNERTLSFNYRPQRVLI